MTLIELYALYKEQMMDRKKIVLCHWKDQTGLEINNIEEFEQIVHELKEEVYLLNEMENDKMYFTEYFVMSKAKPHVIVLRHPLLTNAYFKDLPDQMIESFVSEEENNVYRYLMIDYGKGIKEFIIEFPPNIDFEILKFCTEKMKKGFLTKSKKENSSISLIFTNSSRFTDLDASNFVTYELQSIYPEWEIKKITPLNLSRKFFTDLKKIGKYD